MAGIKISALPVLPGAAAGTDVAPYVQGGVTYKVSNSQLATYFNANLSFVPLAGGTITGPILYATSPVGSTELVNKAYVDTFAQGITVQGACRLASTGALTATYSNGTAGVGATLTNAGAMAALSIDGVAAVVNDRILIKDQASTFENGIYVVTNIGSGAVNWVLTRAADFDTTAEIHPGDLVVVNLGTTNTQTSWLQTATVATIGTDPILFSQFSANPSTFLRVANNLSDVGSQSTSWNNLFPTTEVTAATAALQVDHSYVMNRGTLITATLPALSLVGEIIEIAGVGAGGWLIAQNANQIIHVGSLASSTGVGGSVASTNRYDCVKLRCVVANLEFVVMSQQSAGLTVV